MHKRVAETISDLGIENLANRSVFSLSGGEKQLLAFASVYAMNPQVYVLDEPSANLNHKAMGKLRRILENVKKRGHTVLIAEHRLSYLSGLADRIVYLKAGRIEREFTAAEFAVLSEQERTAMGLRSICAEKIKIPECTFVQPDPSLAVCHLSVKRKKRLILNALSLSANDGDIIGIVGRNGIGKSTFCSALCSLLPTSGGEVIFRSRKLSRRARTRQFGISEFLNLKPEDVDLKEGTMKGGVKTKAGKNRIVPIHPKIRPLIERRLAEGGSRLVCYNGKPFSKTQYRIFWADMMMVMQMNHTPA